MRKIKYRRQSGIVSILLAICLIVLLGVLGLAIDSGRAYLVRAKLNAATDGAVVAAAYAAPRGANDSEHQANAERAAAAFFSANYPSGYLHSSVVPGNLSWASNNGAITIDLSARATVPTTLTSVLGFNQLAVAARSEVVRKSIDMALVVDTTGSLSDPQVSAAVQDNVTNFLNNFDENNDRVALIDFATGPQVDVAFNQDESRGFSRQAMTAAVSNFNFEGGTNTSEAIWAAFNQLTNVIHTPSNLRVIVLFTDGQPNAFASAFATNSTYASCNGMTSTVMYDQGYAKGLFSADKHDAPFNGALDCYPHASAIISELPDSYTLHDLAVPFDGPRTVGTSVTGDNVNNISLNLAENMAEMAKNENILIYTIGYGPDLKSSDGVGTETGEDLLKCIANSPDSARCHDSQKPEGVYCYSADASGLAPCFAKLASEIMRITK